MAAKIKLDKYLGKIINFFSSNTIFPINVFIVTAESKLIWVSDRLLKAAKVEKLEAILHKHISIFGDIAFEGIKRVVSTKKEEIVAEKYDSNCYITCRYPIIGKDSTVKYIFGISFNINKIKQAEFAKQAFLKNVAHDIRTPLSGIIGLARLQQEGLTLKESKEYGQMIFNASNQLLELLNAVMEVIDTKQMIDQIKKEPLDLSGLAKELHALMGPSVYTKGLKFILDIDQDLPVILTDRIKLKRILLNVLSNAIKFTKEGKIIFSVKLLGIDNNSAEVKITIADTGIGIAKENLGKIFDRFYRIHPAYFAEYSGYGLGLYLTKELLNRLEGEVKVTSEEGKGTCFTLQFKFFLAKKVLDKLETVLELTRKTQARSSNTILIAEDCATVRYVLKRQFEEAGYTIIVAVDGKIALEALKKSHVVWALLDLGLPKLEGTQVCQQYRKWEKENNKPRVPIFALTGHNVSDIEKECKKAGIDKVFTKPLNNKAIQEIEFWCWNQESNPGPTDYKSVALPAELFQR